MEKDDFLTQLKTVFDMCDTQGLGYITVTSFLDLGHSYLGPNAKVSVIIILPIQLQNPPISITNFDHSTTTTIFPLTFQILLLLVVLKMFNERIILCIWIFNDIFFYCYR